MEKESPKAKLTKSSTLLVQYVQVGHVEVEKRVDYEMVQALLKPKILCER
jgi:hypothetical protein